MTAAQQSLARWAKDLKGERDRMSEVWDRLKKEQKALQEVKEEMSKLVARGTTDMWRLKSRMLEQLREYEGKIAAAAAEDDQSRKARERMAKEKEEVIVMRKSKKIHKKVMKKS